MKRYVTLALLTLLAACGGGGDDTPAEEAAADQAVSVRLSPVAVRDLTSWEFGEGTARSVRREFLSFESAGRVSYVDPDLREGDPVSEGQLIAHQDPDRFEADLANARADLLDARTRLGVARAQLSEAETSLEIARLNLERFQRLFELDSASQREVEEALLNVEQAEANKAQAEQQIAALNAQIAAAEAAVGRAQIAVRESRLVSPIDGVLARLNVEEGRYFSPNTVQTQTEGGAIETIPALVIDPTRFEIIARLPAYTFGEVETGARALVETRTSGAPPTADDQPLPDGRIPEEESTEPEAAPVGSAPVLGEVYAVAPSIDPQARTYPVRIRTTNGARFLEDGAFVTAWIAARTVEDALAIPLGSVRYRSNTPIVFVARNGTAELREVGLGLQTVGYVQITAGLEEGEQVVTEGVSEVSDGDPLRVIGGVEHGD